MQYNHQKKEYVRAPQLVTIECITSLYAGNTLEHRVQSILFPNKIGENTK